MKPLKKPSLSDAPLAITSDGRLVINVTHLDGTTALIACHPEARALGHPGLRRACRPRRASREAPQGAGVIASPMSREGSA